LKQSEEVWWWGRDVTDDENVEGAGGRKMKLSPWNQYSFLTQYCNSLSRRRKISNAEQQDMEPCVWNRTRDPQQKEG